MSDKPKPFDGYPEIHPLFGRLFQFEADWLKDLKDSANSVTPKDLAIFSAGFRRGVEEMMQRERETK